MHKMAADNAASAAGAAVTTAATDATNKANAAQAAATASAQTKADAAQTAAINAAALDATNKANAAASSAATDATNKANAAAADAKAASVLRSSASVLSATVSIDATSGAGFRAGNLTWDAAGNRTGGYGVAMTPGGIAAYNTAGNLTFALNASTGNAVFSGGVSSSDIYGSSFRTGSYTGWGWPTGYGTGVLIHSNGILMGNPSTGKYIQITEGGDIYTPSWNMVGGSMTLSQANVINTVNIAGQAVTVPVYAQKSNGE